MHGRVVRGVAGERAAYRPILSQLIQDADPVALAKILAGYARELYVADLDAIQGGAIQWQVLEGIIAAGVPVSVDAGAGTVSRARQLAAFATQGIPLAGVVVGLESVGRPTELDALLAAAGGAARAVFSLDLKHGRPLAGPAWDHLSPVEIASAAIAAGFRRLIVLDLADVGRAGGARTLPLCGKLREGFPGVELIAGGGVRSLSDLEALRNAGCDGALVASALHDGRLGLSEIAAAARL